MSISIRFSKAIDDLHIPLPAPGTPAPVYAIKRQIRKARPADTARRRLRLIYAGRMLPESADLASIIPRINQNNSEDTVWLHCSVGDVLTDEELEHESDNPGGETQTQTQTTLPQPLGFDRLRTAGFSDQDIAQLRAQFSRLHGVASGADSDAARQLEERWIDEGASAPDTLPDGSPVGVYEDLLVGTMVGFFLGFFSLFFLREGNIFSKRQQMAIIAGIIINVSFAILRVYY